MPRDTSHGPLGSVAERVAALNARYRHHGATAVLEHALHVDPEPAQCVSDAAVVEATEALCAAVAGASGPVVLVGNEIGLGVIPMGREVRAFVDALGRLNQDVAAVCGRVTLMAAGIPLTLKELA